MINVTHIVLQSAAADITPPAIGLGNNPRIGFIARFTAAGTLSGNLILEVSADGDTWIQRSSTAVAAGANKEIDLETGHAFARLRWSFSAGTGNLEVLARVKE
jgi:hypothetical protein